MRRFNQLRLKAESAFTTLLLGLLIVLVFVAAVLRWVGISIVWSVDTAQFLFTWLCFVGADLAYYHHKHMGVDLVKKRLSPKGACVLEIIITILVMVFMASVFYYGMKLSIANRVRKFNALPISYSLATVAAPIGCFLILLTSIEQLADQISALRKCGTKIQKS